jgi:hypothetical protein
MRYIINNDVELENNYTKIPNSAFYLSAAEFKLYAWLLKHENNFEFGKMFMVRGTKMRNVTIENVLIKLVKKKLITIDDNIITILKVSKMTVKNDTE